MKEDLPDRVTRIEERQNFHETTLGDVVEKLKSLDMKVGQILEAIAGNKGFFHGIVFTLTLLGGVIGAFIAEFWHRITGN